MCGLAGISLSNNAATFDPQVVVDRMVRKMRRRGPDGSGIYVESGLAVGHCRLAILDIDPRASQPMRSSCGRYLIVFNGEIYNFHELRRELEKEGECFRTTSDTEVLLALFARDHDQMLYKLRGMFAFAIWDTQCRELFLARDPYGIKPLYYTHTSNGVLFASQVKTLLASELVSAELEAASLAGFYLWGSVPEPWTIYRGVFALPAGHWMRVADGKAGMPVCWHDIRQHWRGPSASISAGDLQELVRQSVADSVRAHLVSDVPVSVFLSGGIDSAVIAGLAAGSGAQVEGITIGFEEFSGCPADEVPAAAAIAAHYGLPHFCRRISRAEFEKEIPRIFDEMDQPSIDGVNTWFASKAAFERGYKVVLSGVGGDELFYGYSSFWQIPCATKMGRVICAIPGGSALVEAPAAWLAKRFSKPKLAGLPALMGTLAGTYFLQRALFLPAELPALMGVDMAREGLLRLGGAPPGMTCPDARDDSASVGLLESTLYLRNQLLRDSDWASMGHSLEMRTPLADSKLLESLGPYLSGFAGGVGKVMLANTPGKPLPKSISNRRKTGFSLPMEQWLSAARDQHAQTGLPLLAAPETPWARRWARSVVEAMTACA